jgi:hypothetical protein
VLDKRPEFIKLKEPSDIILYVQKVVNRLRREDLEIESIGKITNLLNTFLAAYKTQMEAVELAALKTQIEEIRSRLEMKDDINRHKNGNKRD